jgi:hypothetical protein
MARESPEIVTRTGSEIRSRRSTSGPSYGLDYASLHRFLNIDWKVHCRAETLRDARLHQTASFFTFRECFWRFARPFWKLFRRRRITRGGVCCHVADIVQSCDQDLVDPFSVHIHDLKP